MPTTGMDSHAVHRASRAGIGRLDDSHITMSALEEPRPSSRFETPQDRAAGQRGAVEGADDRPPRVRYGRIGAFDTCDHGGSTAR
jgi:hypothetical protein